MLLAWFALGLTGGDMSGRVGHSDMMTGGMMSGNTFDNTTWKWICGLLIVLLTGALGWMIFSPRK